MRKFQINMSLIGDKIEAQLSLRRMFRYCKEEIGMHIGENVSIRGKQ